MIDRSRPTAGQEREGRAHSSGSRGGQSASRDRRASYVRPQISTKACTNSYRNRIVKRQGALPPWIELQNSLDNAIAAFRSTLETTYTNHLVRTVMTTSPLNPLPSFHTMPGQDAAWEARELKFHEENVKQINDLVRKMNTLAPSPARRHLTTRELELQKIRGDPLRQAVWAEIRRRSTEVTVKPSPVGLARASEFVLDEKSAQRVKQAASQSLSVLGTPVAKLVRQFSSGALSSGHNQHSGDGGASDGGNSGTKPSDQDHPLAGVAVVGAIGLGCYIIFRREAKTESPLRLDEMIPLDRSEKKHAMPFEPVAASPAEPRMTVVMLIQRYVLEPISTLFRFFHLAILFGPVIVLSPMLLVGQPQKRRRPGKPVAEEEENWGAVWWYGFLVKQMERAGPSFIKLGQWAASRADLFPASLCDQMSKLHSNGKPHSLAHTTRVIERAFGMTFDEIFEEFGQEPIGCGAIAQVYRAKLRPSIIGSHNEERKAHHNPDEVPTNMVAIKVLHPRVRKTIRRDIAIMSIFANIINFFPGMEWLSLPDEVAVFGEMMNSQLDLRVEANNLDRFDVNFRKRGKHVVFPKPIKLGQSATGEERKESRDVLMEEFEDALPLKYFLRNGGGPYDDKIANIGLDAFLVSPDSIPARPWC